MGSHHCGQRADGVRACGRGSVVDGAVCEGLRQPAVDHRVVVASVDQEVAGSRVSRPAIHRPADSGERGEFVGACSELLLLLEALLLGCCSSLIGGELVLYDGVALRVVRPAGGGE
ncbi:hypothetical protein [Streptomyces sp. SID161]|uniref:hypothetical protein n=1 Tax=Streptomyces sp. SID161 TaxID=2690251 RepID=UPI00136D281B|nr:hypothetical protein [Streptomyces sp. SID161]MYW43740.1 hypothetical protein [Streptomyces sp. SID161]